MNFRLFNNSADRLPVSIILLISALDFTVYSFVDSTLLLLAYWFAMMVPRGVICAWNHHHQHRNVFKHIAINRILEFFYALQTGVTTNLWLLHHNFGHHKNYLNQNIDESRWQRKDGATMGEFEYSFIVALTAYSRGYEVGKKHPKHQRDFIVFTAITFLILVALTIYNPIAALFVFLLPMVTSLLYTANATYDHHTGLDADDTFKASYNKMSKLYNIFTGNLGYHTAHHYKQGVHWSELPALHEKIKHKIPSELIAH